MVTSFETEVKPMKTLLWYGALAGVLGALSLQAVELLDRPTIYRSVVTRQCAFIELADGTRLNCDKKRNGQRYFYAWSK